MTSVNSKQEFDIQVKPIVKSYKWALDSKLISEDVTFEVYKASVESNEQYNFTD